MKLLLITVRSDFGGGPRHVDQLVKQLPREIELFMAYPEIGDPYAEYWKADKRIKGTFYIPYRKFSLSTLLKLNNVVRENKIDIVHSHGNGAGLYSRMLKMLCPKVKVVHTYHGISDFYSSKIKFYLSKIIGIALSPLADIYVCVSNGEKAMALERRYSKEKNTVVIYNGIPNPEYKESRSINHSPVKIVTLSRFDYQKNMDSMFRIAKFWSGADNVRFVWVGDGEDKERLENLSKVENVPIDFVGFSKAPGKYLLSADLYLSTSRFEGLPYGLIEAASVGLPIVASDVKGNNEVVVDGLNGLLFKEEDQAIGRIKTLLSDKKMYEQMSVASLAYFKRNFTEDQMIDSLVKVYQAISSAC